MKRWEPWENDEVARQAWAVRREGKSLERAAADLAAAVGGTPRERVINVRAGLNAIDDDPSHPRFSGDLKRAIEEQR
jgi:hypothetical protein